MNKKTVIGLLAVVLGLGFAASPAYAGAVSGYVCMIELQPATVSQGNEFGTAGDIQLILYSGANCTGTQVLYDYIFSTGASVPGTNTQWLYTASELQTLYQSLVTARVQGVFVQAGTATTNSTQIDNVSIQ